ncbi:MAG: hypothetical protein KatS3mg013_1315 [Actinomycetota bacterium]|nr:MAG: hypothetical protein KatS3mg013_1315 [Actinomycetota bacterium]
MDQVARVVLGLEGPEVAEEVLHFLDRSGRARVVATAFDARQLAEAAQQLDPDAIVAEPRLAGHLPSRGDLLALATRASVDVLRAAIQARAAGFFVWPDERAELLEGVAARRRDRVRPTRSGTVIAVHGSRGGAGTTFVAAHLARAIARRGRACCLVEGDLVYGDLASALGAGEDARTIAALAPLREELSWNHLADVAWRHEGGFAVVLPPRPGELDAIEPELVGRVVEAAAAGSEAVVVALPRALSAATRRCLAEADRVLEVLTLDVLSFRAAARAREAFSPLAHPGRVGFVVNRAARSEITPGDVARVFGAEPIAVLPRDGSVPRAQDHGRLLPARGRLARAFDRLAAAVLEPAAVPEERAS